MVILSSLNLKRYFKIIGFFLIFFYTSTYSTIAPCTITDDICKVVIAHAHSAAELKMGKKGCRNCKYQRPKIFFSNFIAMCRKVMMGGRGSLLVPLVCLFRIGVL